MPVKLSIALFLALVAVVASQTTDQPLIGGFQDALLNDDISKQALATATSALIKQGLCDAGINLGAVTRQTVKGANYNFVYNVDPSMCKLNKTWTSCLVIIAWDLKTFSVTNISCS